MTEKCSANQHVWFFRRNIVRNHPNPSTVQNSKLNISPALRHLANGVFSKALIIAKDATDSLLKNIKLENLSDCAKKLIWE